ncbi:MAG TPA: alpha-ketoglutarate-dependent dioxygenase AlkB [Blastocatellia bacterium]|nr:alpha-ketoglutarate-dependent dioxygenase AlkB [Blastocatellia bacterium]
MRCEQFSLPDADISYFPQAFTNEASDLFLVRLKTEIAWRQDSIKLFSKEIPQPRLTAWYGDEGAIYTYSNLTNHPLPWTDALREIKARAEEIAQTSFNSVLLNYYRDGQDSMGWHQDNEPELGPNPIIASVNFGATRRFQFRHKKRKDLDTITIDLEHGSLLLMQGTTQNYWKHQLPKTIQPVGARINLTFRFIHSINTL